MDIDILTEDETKFIDFILNSKETTPTVINDISIQEDGKISLAWEKLLINKKAFEAESLAKIVKKRRVTATLAYGSFSVPIYLRLNDCIRGRIVGVSSSKKILGSARQLSLDTKVKIELHESYPDQFTLPSSYGKFDLITCLQGDHQCQNWDLAIDRMIDLLAPRGLIVISFVYKGIWGEKVASKFLKKLSSPSVHSDCYQNLVLFAFQKK